MRRLLIADLSEDSASLLTSAFQKEYEIEVCRRGDALADALQAFRPNLMILDLMMPVMDGFEAMRRSKDLLPPVILAITTSNSDYVIYTAMELGVGHLLMRPFTIRAAREQLSKMVWLAEHPECRRVTPQAITLRHLEILGFVPGHDGFQQLRTGLAILSQDPTMSLGKELYPAVCQRMGGGDPRTVEHNIRTSVKEAWGRRDPELWNSYFPRCNSKAPTNSEFLRRLALLVEEEMDQQICPRPLPTKEKGTPR